MKKQNKKNIVSKTTSNIERIRKAIKHKDSRIVVDDSYYYYGFWDKDEAGEDCLRLDSENLEMLTFSKNDIEKGIVDYNTITMMADDGEEHLVRFIIVEPAM